MKKSLIALAFGTLALGMTEFVMMGILADVANALGITIPQAGHLVSAYALGVTCGAPLLAVAKQFRPKSILLFLVCLIFIGALISSVAQSYEMLLVARFISGLPHGAYFGVASIVAVRLADEGHKTGAVSTMIAGMTVANLLGVPLETALSAHISWRMPFIIISFYSLLVIYYIWKWVPQLEVTPSNGYKGQFRFLKTGAPWLILGATMLGNGGVFCFYSYVTPILTSDGGIPYEYMSAIMILAGFGMVVGNLVSGKLSDRYTPGRVATAMILFAATSLMSVFIFAHNGWVAAAFTVFSVLSMFAMSSPQQYLILKHAPGGEMLGGACIQMAFNMGNAVGAFLGGLPIAAGLDDRYAAIVGAPMALGAAVLMTAFCVKYEKNKV